MGGFGTPRRKRRGDSDGSRFRRAQRPREEYVSKLVQSVTLTVLCAALVWLLSTSVRLIRAHFLEKSGSQAWLLPIIIGLILMFLLYRLVKLWTEVRALRHELRRSAKSLNDKDVH